MTIFTGKMSRRTQLVIEIITNLCLIAFGVIKMCIRDSRQSG